MGEPLIASPLAMLNDAQKMIRRSTAGIEGQDVTTDSLRLL
jgi:hypothetical protein